MYLTIITDKILISINPRFVCYHPMLIFLHFSLDNALGFCSIIRIIIIIIPSFGINTRLSVIIIVNCVLDPVYYYGIYVLPNPSWPSNDNTSFSLKTSYWSCLIGRQNPILHVPAVARPESVNFKVGFGWSLVGIHGLIPWRKWEYLLELLGLDS